MRTAAWMLALVALAAALGACAAAVIGAEAPTDPALLQSGAKAYSAAAARASLHAGARATHQRFHSTLARAGVSHPARPTRGRQDHSGVNAQQVMMEVVEKVLADREAKEAAAAASPAAAAFGADPVAEAASEFHLLNSLMEAQSELREHGAHSTERDRIGGVDRKFLQTITDRAVANALNKVRAEHPSKPMGRLSEPLHLYGVRKLYTAPEEHQASLAASARRGVLYSEEALADPYLSRHAHLDSVAETSAFASRISPSVVYRLGERDRVLLAEREQLRNSEYLEAQRQSAAKARAAQKPHPHKRAAHPIPGTAQAPSSPAAAAAAAAGGANAPSFLEEEAHVETHPDFAHDPVFLELQQRFQAELASHAQRAEDEPWFRLHDAEEDLSDSTMAAETPLSHWTAQLQRDYATAEEQQEEAGEGDANAAMLEVDAQVDTEAGEGSMPLRELGILLGLSPKKKVEPAQETPQPPPPAAAATLQPKPAAVPAPAAATPRFTQTKTSAEAGAQAQAHAGAKHAARDDGLGAEADPAAAAADDPSVDAAADDSLYAMVFAGEEYTPDSLKHPPPPPVPPPPPPPPPPQFDAF